jgi:hypothetical protein
LLLAHGGWPPAAPAPDNRDPTTLFKGPVTRRGRLEPVMSRFNRMLCTLVAVAAMAGGIPTVLAQAAPRTSIVGIYRIAPGEHLAFLKWMASQEAAAASAGAPPTQWYRHLDGDSWDYIALAPAMDDALRAKADAAARAQGQSTGMKSGLELRELMASHTDTYVSGPSTAAELVQEATRP